MTESTKDELVLSYWKVSIDEIQMVGHGDKLLNTLRTVLSGIDQSDSVQGIPNFESYLKALMELGIIKLNDIR